MTGLNRFNPAWLTIPVAVIVVSAFLASIALAASSRDLAASRYRKASLLYNDLKQVPRLELGVKQYELVISAFKGVQRADPASGYCDDALMAIAELYQEMATRFGQVAYRLKAIETYQYAAREYPHSKHRTKALAIAKSLGGADIEESYRPPESPAATARGASADAATPALSDITHAAGTVVRPTDSGRTRNQKAAISQFRYHSYEDGTRVVLEMGGKTPLKYERLKRPERLYIDLFDARLSGPLLKGVQSDISDSLLSAARLAQNRTSKARLVLDLKRAVSFDAFWLTGPVRLVLDIRPSGAARLSRTLQALNPTSTPAPVRTPAPVAPRAAERTVAGKHSLTRALGLKLGRVLVDAGHGGHDTGSIGHGGLLEKDVVLDVSKRLGDLLRDRLGAEVIYSRDSDTFVPLEERTKIANERGADLMISIHCNSAPSSRVRGIETYYLNFTSDEWELSVASTENAAASRSIHELGDLLSQIARNDKIDESREFATKVQSRLHSGISRHSSSIKNRGIRKAPFVVLINAEMPAVLAEIGFISNRTDESLMRKASFRQEVAEYLFDGISEYAKSLGTLSRSTSLSAGSSLRD